MIISLFILNAIVFVCTSLSLVMFSNHIKKINKSIHIYLDPKVYKSKSKVEFLASLVQKYEIYKEVNPTAMDIEALIRNYFYEQNIGIFSTQGVESFARKGKELVWFSTIAMTLYEVLNNSLGTSKLNLIFILISTGFGLSLILFQILTAMDAGKEKLFIRIKDYLGNRYPHHVVYKKQKEERNKLLNRIEELENEIERVQRVVPTEFENQKESVEEEVLEEKDIAYLVEYLSVPDSLQF